jgi:von Willebrand factor type A domain
LGQSRIMEFGSNPHEEEAALAQRVARVFGYDGLTIEVREGEGWKTIRGEDNITLVVDPSMLQPQVIKDATGNELPAGTQAPEQYSVYGIAHELGHVDDFLQPESEFEKLKAMLPSEHFFWNVLDDGVINARLRNIPLLNRLTDEIYQDMLFPLDDYTKVPKHVQLMYGWLMRNVTPQREVSFSDEVNQALDSLEDVEINGQQYDLYRSLTHSTTTYAQRKEIAEAHILPIYQAFLEADEDDRQEQTDQQDDQHDSGEASQNGGGGSQNGEANDYQAIYQAYTEASHCGDEHDGEGGDDTEAQGESSDAHDAIKEAAGALQEQQAQQQAVEEGKPQDGSQTIEGAGTMAAELQLSVEDAGAYRKVIEQYRPQIHEVAKILQQLTVPSTEHTSPRYRRHPDTVGSKLSPKDLFQVAVAHHSNADPAIWKPIEAIVKREGLSFNGLDVHLLVDASGSMQGKKAESAAACSVMLMEGLNLARRMVERYSPQAPKPDVRLQVALFGSLSAEVVIPLRHETQPSDKGVAFTTIRAARARATYVADALQQTVAIANANPKRIQMVHVITDGDFSDRGSALSAIEKVGKNYFLAQYILLSPGAQPITRQVSHLSNPSELPAALNMQLKALVRKFQL